MCLGPCLNREVVSLGYIGDANPIGTWLSGIMLYGGLFRQYMSFCFYMASSSLCLHAVDLHRLLHWRNNEERLPSILTAVTKVAGDEIVKVRG